VLDRCEDEIKKLGVKNKELDAQLATATAKNKAGM